MMSTDKNWKDKGLDAVNVGARLDWKECMRVIVISIALLVILVMLGDA
jgi:hypothetical protein